VRTGEKSFGDKCTQQKIRQLGKGPVSPIKGNCWENEPWRGAGIPPQREGKWAPSSIQVLNRGEEGLRKLLRTNYSKEVTDTNKEKS